ncbi:MAG: dienelactone hydrolase family protein [Planctomycetia bacterium]|nr:dienelactone hydrolase family protein [Planctomycetia bacterium]
MKHDLTRLDIPPDTSRRDFVAAALATGFALAVQPISAQTITTDTTGLDAGDAKIPVGSETIPGYFARPKGDGPFPVVLVVQEIFGVHEHIKDICRRLAKLGYLAVAPDLYVRQGDTSKIKEFKDIFKVVATVPDVQVMTDLDATAAWARKDGKGDAGKLAITGFCWGGRIVWLYSAHSKELKAGVAWYGRLVGDADKLHPKHPVDSVADLNAPVLGLYGAADTGIPVKTVDQMRDALKKAKKPSEIELYPETPHGFYADYRPSYRKDKAEDAWKKMLAWFEKNGVK